jgi:hypothetical protein
MAWRRHYNEKTEGSEAPGKSGFRGLGMALKQLFLSTVFTEQTDSQWLFITLFCICTGLIVEHIVSTSFLFVLFYQNPNAKYSVFLGIIPDWRTNKRNRERVK